MLANEKNILAGKKVRRGGILQNMAILSLIKIGQIGLDWFVGFKVALRMTRASRSVSGGFDIGINSRPPLVTRCGVLPQGADRAISLIFGDYREFS